MGNNRYAFHPSFELLAYKMLTDTDMMHLQILASYPALHSIFFSPFLYSVKHYFFNSNFFLSDISSETGKKREKENQKVRHLK